MANETSPCYLGTFAVAGPLATVETVVVIVLIRRGAKQTNRLGLNASIETARAGKDFFD